ncbi:MAG TPA: FAD-dependent oxidoreductase [Solirubrobacteraceae bacterium]|nr:FAD-dependent oxidoreductase [Solirubrobacteraceae bacterium]
MPSGEDPTGVHMAEPQNSNLLADASPPLTPAQLAKFAELGEEHIASVGEKLYEAGDPSFPLIVVIEGEVTIVDEQGNEVIRHGPSRFLGELNLLSGQTALVSAVVTQPLRYIVVGREAMRSLMVEDAPLSDLLLSTFIARRELLQQTQVGLEITGPRSSRTTQRMLDFARSNRLPFTWRDTERADEQEGAAAVSGLDESSLPLVRLPGGEEMRGPTRGEVSRALGLGRDLAPREEVDLLVVGIGPAGLGAAVYGASEGLRTMALDSTALGGQAGFSRRIENYLGFPAGITGSELTSRAVTQARKFNAQLATPYRAVALEPEGDGHVVRLKEGQEIAARAVLLATGAQYRPLPVKGVGEFEGTSVFYSAGPAEAQLVPERRVAVVGGGNSAGQAAVWLVRNGAHVTLLHRRQDLRETMSDYLVREVEDHGVLVRGSCEIIAVHGAEGQLEAVTLANGERIPVSFLFLFLGAEPHTDWLGDSVKRDDSGFILTGAAAGAETLLETSVPGVFAAGDARSGSAKRVAAAVGEGAMAIQLVHAWLATLATAGRAV